MALEIERKYLVINEKWRESVESEKSIRQGYLSSSGSASVRVRIAGDKANINIKSATAGISRLEYEYDIPLQDAEELLDQLAEKPLIEKTRYRVRQGDHLWDLDQFFGENQGLVVAEVELDAEDEAFEKPEWAGDEVSDDRRYYNASLIKHPYSRW